MSPALPTRFTIRVYGLLLNEQQEILVSDEHIRGHDYTKFPGGGLEFGEGTIAALKREFVEEMGVEIEVFQHFYTTDFYVVSHFNDQVQVISIYYLVRLKDGFVIPTASKPFDFKERIHGALAVRWLALQDLTPKNLSFVIDQKVGELLRNKHLS